jgi:hypothetical protein
MFSIEIRDTPTLAAVEESDRTLGEALQSIYSIGDDAYLTIDSTQFRIGLKYDLGLMIDDLVPLVRSVQEKPAGHFRIDWASSSFPFEWSLDWTSEVVDLRSRRRAEGGSGPTEFRARIPRADFLAQWGLLLRSVLSALTRAGYSESQISNLDQLRKACAAN